MKTVEELEDYAKRLEALIDMTKPIETVGLIASDEVEAKKIAEEIVNEFDKSRRV